MSLPLRQGVLLPTPQPGCAAGDLDYHDEDVGWDGEKRAENAKLLAKLTKGYGGARPVSSTPAMPHVHVQDRIGSTYRGRLERRAARASSDLQVER